MSITALKISLKTIQYEQSPYREHGNVIVTFRPFITIHYFCLLRAGRWIFKCFFPSAFSEVSEGRHGGHTAQEVLETNGTYRG